MKLASTKYSKAVGRMLLPRQLLRWGRLVSVHLDVVRPLLALLLTGLHRALDVVQKRLAHGIDTQERAELLLQPPRRRPFIILCHLLGQSVANRPGDGGKNRREHGLKMFDLSANHHAFADAIQDAQRVMGQPPRPAEFSPIAAARVVQFRPGHQHFDPAGKYAVEMLDASTPNGCACRVQLGRDGQQHLGQSVLVDAFAQGRAGLAEVRKFRWRLLRLGFRQIEKRLYSLRDDIGELPRSMQFCYRRGLGRLRQGMSNTKHSNQTFGFKNWVHI